MKIIPAIDLKDGKCVRLFKGDFERVTEYSTDPLAVAQRFAELDVGDLHIVDLDGARSGTQAHAAIVRRIARESRLSIQLGGGIRQREDVERWFDAGVSRCVIGSVAIRDPETVQEWIDEYGSDRIVLALDVQLSPDGTPMLTTHGWTEESGVSLWDCLAHYQNVQHVLCTDVERDGALAGPNIELYERILDRHPGLSLQASGGVRDLRDLEALRAAGLPAAITGRALLDGRISSTEVRSFRQNA